MKTIEVKNANQAYSIVGNEVRNITGRSTDANLPSALTFADLFDDEDNFDGAAVYAPQVKARLIRDPRGTHLGKRNRVIAVEIG